MAARQMYNGDVTESLEERNREWGDDTVPALADLLIARLRALRRVDELRRLL
jgi:hypothetical protein